MWVCPNCHRQFRNTNQDHSCLVTDPRLHFIGKNPKLEEIYRILLERITKFGNFRINSVKNAILITRTSHFMAVKPRKNWLDIEFVLSRQVEGFPIHKTIQASKNKWAHFMRIESPDEINAQLIGWLREAWECCEK